VPLVCLPDPFPDVGPSTPIGERIVEAIPDAADFETINDRCGETINRLWALYSRVLTALVDVASRIEGALGLPPPPPFENDKTACPSSNPA
jgi:hypothetical protein